MARVEQDAPAPHSIANQTPLSFVDQDVGDDRGTRRSHPATLCPIPFLQFLENLPPRRVGEQILQFFLPHSKRFRLKHAFFSSQPPSPRVSYERFAQQEPGPKRADPSRE